MESIHSRAEITIEEGKIEEFKKLAQEMSIAVQAGEPGTLGYQFYLDGTKCIVNETYASSEAALAHAAGAASKTILPKIFHISKMSRLDVYGSPSKELQKLLTNLGANIYHPIAGFSR